MTSAHFTTMQALKRNDKKKEQKSFNDRRKFTKKGNHLPYMPVQSKKVYIKKGPNNFRPHKCMLHSKMHKHPGADPGFFVR